MIQDKEKDEKAEQSSTLVPYANPAKLDREFLDLHGIPYPEDTLTGPRPTEPKSQIPPS